MPVLHHDAALYPEPEQVRPERFLNGNDPGPGAWLPFGGGARRCPGANMALFEMRVCSKRSCAMCVSRPIARNLKSRLTTTSSQSPTAVDG